MIHCEWTFRYLRHVHCKIKASRSLTCTFLLVLSRWFWWPYTTMIYNVFKCHLVPFTPGLILLTIIYPICVWCSAKILYMVQYHCTIWGRAKSLNSTKAPVNHTILGFFMPQSFMDRFLIAILIAKEKHSMYCNCFIIHSNKSYGH